MTFLSDQMGDEKEQFREMLNAILDRAKVRDAARYALAQLFPKAEKELETYVPEETLERGERKRQRRISERDFAPAYFRLDPQPAAWGHSEIETILDSTNPAGAFAVVETRIAAATEKDRPRLRRLFLEALDGAFGVRRPFNLQWLQAILDASPQYVVSRYQTPQFLISIDNADRIRWIIVHALEQIPADGWRNLLVPVIESVRDISVLCDLVRGLAGDIHPDGAKTHRPAAFQDSSEEVRDQLLDRVRRLAVTNQIWSQALPGEILWFWWGCNLEGEVKSFTSDAMKTVEGLRGLLNVTVSLVRSSSGDYEHVRYSTWSKIVNLEILEDNAHRIKVSSTDESDRNLAERFLKALDKGRSSRF
jgi:hypothetical protein